MFLCKLLISCCEMIFGIISNLKIYDDFCISASAVFQEVTGKVGFLSAGLALELCVSGFWIQESAFSAEINFIPNKGTLQRIESLGSLCQFRLTMQGHNH